VSQMQTSSAIKSSPQQVLVWSLCALALGLLGWRGLAIFTNPPAAPSPHPLSAMVETVVGPGNARISATASGELLILLNGPVGAIDPATAMRLTEIASAISATGSAPLIKQFPFAREAVSAPTQTELAELSILGLIAGLAFYCALAMRSAAAFADRTPKPISGSMQMPSAFLGATAAPPPFDNGPHIAPANLMPGQANEKSLADAQRFAQDNPEVTAQVIEHWIRARGFEE